MSGYLTPKEFGKETWEQGVREIYCKGLMSLMRVMQPRGRARRTLDSLVTGQWLLSLGGGGTEVVKPPTGQSS